MKYKYSLPWFKGKWLVTDKVRYYILWKLIFPIYNFFLSDKVRESKGWWEFEEIVK